LFLAPRSRRSLFIIVQAKVSDHFHCGKCTPPACRACKSASAPGAKNLTPDATDAFIAAEMAKWQPLLRGAGIVPN
jgi:hypothetical protein